MSSAVDDHPVTAGLEGVTFSYGDDTDTGLLP
jgi:hypothetical protein